MIRKVLRGIQYVGAGLVLIVILAPCVVFIGMLKIIDKIVGEEDYVNSKQKKRG